MKQRKNNRFLAMLMAMLMIVSTVATGWYPVVAKADTKRIYPRTPNSVESWHRRVNHIIGKTHIGIYKFISKLKLEFINAKTQICRI